MKNSEKKESKMRKVILNDVVLRESAQVAGGAMPPDDQIRYVDYLVKNGMDIIEIGFPASSQDDFDKCQRIVKFVESLGAEKRPILSGLARAMEKDIESVKKSGCDMVHIYGNTPEGKRQWVLDQAVAMVKYAKELGFEHIQYSPEDAAHTGRDFLCQIVEAVIEAGATSVNIPDTTGMYILDEFGNLVSHIFETVPNISRARIACHCHNDSDAGTANALHAIANGIQEVQGTFYGLGERSGMTKFESVIMNVNMRRDVFSDVKNGFRPDMALEIVDFVATSLGMPIPRHWLVVGQQNAVVSS